MKKLLRRKWEYIAILCYLLCFFLFYYLFSMQAQGIFKSDLAMHINTALSGQGYSLLNAMYRLIYWMTHSVKAICIVLSILTLTVAVIIGWFMKKFLDNSVQMQSGKACLLGLAMLFICHIYIPVISPFFYSNSHVTQPWHNQTYSLMRLGGLLTLVMYIKIEKNYLIKIKWKDAIIFTLLLTVTNALKPNFFLFFAVMMLCYLITDFIRTKGKSCIANIKFGGCVLISCPILLAQSEILYPSGGESGITLTLEKLVSFLGSWEQIFGTIVSIMFPILVYIWAKVERNSTKRLGMAWVMFLVATLEYFILTETGPRAAHGNFGWGRRFAAQILFIFSLIKYIELVKHNPQKRILCIVAGVFLAANIVCGLVYFGLLLGGENYLQ